MPANIIPFRRTPSKAEPTVSGDDLRKELDRLREELADHDFSKDLEARFARLKRRLAIAEADRGREHHELEQRERERLWRAARPPPGSGEHEGNVADVIHAALNGSPAAVSRMADLARGAVQPGKTFDAALVSLVRALPPNDAFRKPDLIEIYASVLSQVYIPESRLPLLEGLTEREIRVSLSNLLRRYADGKIKAKGVVADLVFAAVQRGVKFGQGSTLGRKGLEKLTSPRDSIVKIIDNAVRRYDRST